MAGIYIHVPFCTSRCIYCDFYSQTNPEYKTAYVQAVVSELALRKFYLGHESIGTIYFGGGTPSLLQATDFDVIFDSIHRHYHVLPDAEITLEANPDDLTPTCLSSLHPFPFNRISLGVQSFDDNDLQMLHRRHNGRQAIEAVHKCRDKGYANISIDLMYGLPGQTPERWENNLHKALELNTPHLSAYHLTYEEGTPINRQAQAGLIQPVSEETSERLFYTLINVLTQAGYLHYEISNFCLPDMFSRHNTAYWNGTKYLGVGPAAHSYDGHSRQWNVASLTDYIAGMMNNAPLFENETLDVRTRYNEYVMTRLRTMWGINCSSVRDKFGQALYDHFLRQIQPYLRCGLLQKTDKNVFLAPKGLFISDGIIRNLIKV
ncbi:MAG: radical SAM family heme chaperone HemW [Tannerella sp.]|jgi:oxygen-independent coproporphyrinogen-3 oxidase|nr:radical SAM family heme chaperone HemW [Tannerella sp.]